MEIVDLIMSGGDVERASNIDVHERVPWVESPFEGVGGMECIGQLSSPRLMVTHLPARYYEVSIGYRGWGIK